MSTSPHSPHRRLPRPDHHTNPSVAPSARDATAVPGEGNQLLYTPAEAAAQLRIRESWLRRMAGLRQIPCTFLGKHLRFSAADLTAIVAQNGQAPTGRRPRRRGSRSTVRDRDLPASPMRSVDPPVPDDHNRDDGSSAWRG